MNDHISKPIDPENMYTVLAKWIHPDPALLSESAAAIVASRLASIPDSLAIPPPQEFPSIPGMNTQSGLRNMNGDTKLYMEILSKFARSQRESYQTMVNLLDASEWSTLERTAHTLKGIAATIGATNLSESARSVENGAGMGMGRDRLRVLIEKTSQELDAVLMSLDTVIPKQTEPNLSGGASEEDGVTDMEALTPLFRQAAEFLRTFDPEAEASVVGMEIFVKSGIDRERLRKLKQFLEAYDYEACLKTLQDWADDAGVQLENTDGR